MHILTENIWHITTYIYPFLSVSIPLLSAFFSIPSWAKCANSTHLTSIKWLSDVYISVWACGLAEWPFSKVGMGSIVSSSSPVQQLSAEGCDGCLQDRPPQLWVILSLSLCPGRSMCWRHWSALNWIAAGLITDVSVCRVTWDRWSSSCQARASLQRLRGGGGFARWNYIYQS